jgi:transposase
VPRAATAGAAAKKKSLHDSQRDTPRVRGLRREFAGRVRRTLRHFARRLHFLDEFGVHLGLTRLCGRAAPGRRVVEGTPGYSGPHYTVVAALGPEGVVAPLVLEGSMDKATFESYVEQCLAPALAPGAIVLMDNLSAHKGAAVRQAIRGRRAGLVFLPPYSPDLNPIEKGWSKVKTALRAAKARSFDALLDALGVALAAIDPGDVAAWLTHCGYTVNA